MPRWKVRVESELSRAKIILSDGDRVAGVVTVAWNDYVTMIHGLMGLVLETSKDALKESLMKKLWADAQLMFDMSPELAKAKLLEFGWSEQKIEQYADELSIAIAQKLTDFIPEVS